MIKWIKSHTTPLQIEEGLISPFEHFGNACADNFAELGSKLQVPREPDLKDFWMLEHKVSLIQDRLIAISLKAVNLMVQTYEQTKLRLALARSKPRVGLSSLVAASPHIIGKVGNK